MLHLHLLVNSKMGCIKSSDKRPFLCTDSDSESEPEDNVRLWEDGWKERYYNNKFGVPADDEEFVNAVVSNLISQLT